MVEHCQVAFKPESSGGQEFHFPVNPPTITISHRRAITKVPVLGLGEVILPGSMSPASISFEAMLPRPEAYAELKSICNYRVVEKPEESVSRFERWMGRTQYGQTNPEVIRVEITGSGFSRQMVLTEVSSEYRPGEPDALYVNVSLEEWKGQSVKITQGPSRPLLPERPGIVRSGSGSPVDDDDELDNELPTGNNGLPDGGDPFYVPVPTSHTTSPNESWNDLWKRYASGEDKGAWITQVILLNRSKFASGGEYYQKFRYKDLSGGDISAQEWLEIYHNPITTDAEKRQLANSRELLYTDQNGNNGLPGADRSYLKLPFPVVLALPKLDAPSSTSASTPTVPTPSRVTDPSGVVPSPLDPRG